MARSFGSTLRLDSWRSGDRQESLELAVAEAPVTEGDATAPDRSRRVWIVCLAGAALLGVVLALLLPMLSGYDEEDHILRAYQVSHFQVIGEKRGGDVGGDVAADFASVSSGAAALQTLRAHPDEFRPQSPHVSFYDFRGFFAHHNRGQPKVFEDFRNTAIYSPVPYLPSAVALGAGRLLHVSPTGSIYLARLLQVLTYVGLLGLAVRLLPAFAPVTLCIGLLPTPLVQAATVSADAVLNGLVLLTLASVLRNLRSPRPAAEMLVLSLGLALCKPLYVPLMLGYLLPLLRGRRERRVRRDVAVVGAAVLVAGGWTLWSNRIFVPILGLFQKPIVPAEQAARVHHHPTIWLSAVGRLMEDQGGYLLRSMLVNITRADYHVPLPLVLLLVVPLLAAVTTSQVPGVTRTMRWFCIGVVVVEIVLVLYVWYIKFTSLGANIVQGIQGRYFLPMLPMVAVAVTPSRTVSSGRTISSGSTPGSGRALVRGGAPVAMLVLAAVCFALALT